MKRKEHYYGLIGNGQTAALIGPDLSIGWFCPGRFDNFPLFAGALDPVKGGTLSLSIDTGCPLSLKKRHYLDGTNTLHTLLDNEQCEVAVKDLMPWQIPLFLRQLDFTNKGGRDLTVTLDIAAVPIETSLCKTETFCQDGFLNIVLSLEESVAALLPPGQSPKTSVSLAVAARRPGSAEVSQLDLRLNPGNQGRHRVKVPVPADGRVQVFIAMSYAANSDTARAVLKANLEGLGDIVRRESEFWRQWIAKAKVPAAVAETPELLKAYQRSLLVLKLLTFEETGAIIAAPTASFPATPGGNENWDYRYAWLRDGYYCALAFDKAGFHEEARRFYDFIGRLQARDGSWPQPLYTVAGHNPAEYIAPDLAGPLGEKPVRFGNKAAEQLQLDNTGNILDGIWQHFRLSGDEKYLRSWWPRVVKAADWVMANWRREENGIWEFREFVGHWVHGKVMCYAALTAAADIARVVGEEEIGEKWRKEAETIAAEVVEKGWSEKRQAYVECYGGMTLDISVLALEFYGLLPAGESRLVSTVAAMEKDLRRQRGLNINGGIARYDFAAVPFYLPTFWLARYYLHAGQKERAMELINTCLGSATDLWLMAEHFDPVEGTQWGNFPQAFSHEELVQTLLDL